MKRGLSTLILLAVAAGLGAYIYFVESKRKPAAERAEEKAKVFAGLEAAAIEEIEVKAAGGDLTKLRKENGAWKIVAPISSGVDEAEVSGITSNLASLEVQRVVEEAPADLAQFGLAPAKTEVSFRAGGDSGPRRLLIGDKTATGGDLYAKTGADARVFLISGFLDTTFNRATFDLRDKSVLAFDRDKVTGIEIVSPERTVRFAKEGDTWRLTSPVDARADYGTVEGLIGRIASGQMKSLVADAPADLAQYGLESPARSISFAAGSARSTLVFGDKNAEGQFFARDASRPLVFTVDTFLADDLSKAAEEFRPKDVYDFRTFTGTRFEITRGGATTVFEKVKGGDANAPETWAQVQPKPEKPIESARIEDFLSKMSNLRAQGFVEALPAGATEAARTAARWSDGKKEETVVFHRSGEDVFAVRGNEPGAARLTASDFDDAMKTLDAAK
jgi:hypothetical protein